MSEMGGGGEMTINTWRSEIIKICKTCQHLYDRGEGRYRYRCEKYACNVHKAYGCNKLHNTMKEAKAISDRARREAFDNLVKPL
jgi:hypothetical protein